MSVPAVRLYPFLWSRYSDKFLDNICVIKIDTEGHDVVILADLPAQLRPPVIWVEWFREFQFADLSKLLLEVRVRTVGKRAEFDQKWKIVKVGLEKAPPFLDESRILPRRI